MNDVGLMVLGGLLLLALLALALGLRRQQQALAAMSAQWAAAQASAQAQSTALSQQVGASSERLERELRSALGEGLRDTRQELTHQISLFQNALVQQSAEAARTQNTQLDALGQQLTLLQKTLHDTLSGQLVAMNDANARGLSEVRDALTGQLGSLSEGNARALTEVRDTLQQQLSSFQTSLIQQSAEATRTQNTQLDAFGQQLALLQKTLHDTLTGQLVAMNEANARGLREVRDALTVQLASLSEGNARALTEVRDVLTAQLGSLSEANARRLGEIRETFERQLAALQASNLAKLDEMRATVDEKLQSTLEQRLGERFKQVAERLEQVHRGLGEMQTLATGVGDLKHLLTNVKTRGIFGEAQLGALLEQALTPDQYAAQVPTRPGSKAVVDYAVRLPGKSDDGAPVWLPIDAKFPNEDYERLLDAQSRADAAAAEAAGRALEQRIRLEAKSMAEKYLAPPHTTDFAILFLPTEGLYAEVLRRPGLMQALQNEHRITLAGPTTLLALLGALHMGFRTLALERRASEVWQVLGAVKTEFGKFGDVLAKVRSQTETVLRSIDSAQVRSRAMGRALKSVEALPEPAAVALIGTQTDDASADAAAP
ncbi:MAG: DNA recombination protein RmuC [Rhodoferax sp.]